MSKLRVVLPRFIMCYCMMLLSACSIVSARGSYLRYNQQSSRFPYEPYPAQMHIPHTQKYHERPPGFAQGPSLRYDQPETPPSSMPADPKMPQIQIGGATEKDYLLEEFPEIKGVIVSSKVFPILTLDLDKKADTHKLYEDECTFTYGEKKDRIEDEKPKWLFPKKKKVQDINFLSFTKLRRASEDLSYYKYDARVVLEGIGPGCKEPSLVVANSLGDTHDEATAYLLKLVENGIVVKVVKENKHHEYEITLHVDIDIVKQVVDFFDMEEGRTDGQLYTKLVLPVKNKKKCKYRFKRAERTLDRHGINEACLKNDQLAYNRFLGN